jgi:hypothetical protein
MYPRGKLKKKRSGGIDGPSSGLRFNGVTNSTIADVFHHAMMYLHFLLFKVHPDNA